MAKVTINGTEHEFEDGLNLVDAAASVGVNIPHYCYHPGLSIAGQCRMCYVEQEGNPKLQIACNTTCRDGLKVRTDSEKVEQAVKWSLEFHLINHPIDCPICDQAGECGLQDYFMKHGKYKSQMREHKVNKEKAVSIGDQVMLDKERCILCGRCVRFTEEVSKTGSLAIFNRGDRSVIGTINDEPMTDNYQLNTVDICPVGALTSKDFRFEQRVWFLDEAESVCGGCSKGCNIYVHHKSGKHIYRLKPRYNPEINSYWMCDQGRETYKWSNYDRRNTDALLGGVELPMHEAIQTWAGDLRTLVATERSDEIAVWFSPHLTNEELHSIISQFKDEFGVTKFYSENIEKLVNENHSVDQLLLQSDPYPNSKGFLEVLKAKGVSLRLWENLIDDLEKNRVNHLIVFAPENERSNDIFSSLSAAVTPSDFVVVLSAQNDAVEIFQTALSLPILSHLEKTGTMLNHAGIKQHLDSKLHMFKDSASIQNIVTMLRESYRNPTEVGEKRISGGST